MLTEKRHWIGGLVLITGIAWAVVRDAEEHTGFPGGWVSVFVAFILPALTPLIVLKDLALNHALEGWIGSLVVSTWLQPSAVFDEADLPEMPDYSNEAESWASLPWVVDTADGTPPYCGKRKCTEDRQGHLEMTADIFYLAPTTFYDACCWNAPFNDSFANYLQDEAILPQQAQAFNSAGRIFAPRIRQMTGFAYFSSNATAKRAAIELAYDDVRRAFEYYLANWNHGRPIILAGHSQGSEHGTRLLLDFFGPGKPWRSKLVAAYLIGMPLYRDVLKEFNVCSHPGQVNCVVAFQSFAKGSDPMNFHIEPAHEQLRSQNKSGSNRICVNPLTWTADDEYGDASQNSGSMHIIQFSQNLHFLFAREGDTVLERRLHRVTKSLLPLRAQLVGAKCENGVLNVDDLPFTESGSSAYHVLFPVWRAVSFPGGNLHPLDFNLFWGNLRQNAQHRVQSWYFQT